MVGSPVVPRILSVPGSSVSLTVMARLVSDRGLFRNKSRISENGVGLNRLSGCITPKKADKLPSVDVVRLVALGLDGLHRWGPWSFGGWWWFGIGFALEVDGEDEGSGEGFGDEVFCSVIFLFILIYYNNEIPVVLHSYSENYIFFEYGNLFFFERWGWRFEMKTPTFRRVRKNTIKKLKNIFICLCLVAVQAQSSRPDLIGYCRNLDWVLLGWGVQSVERFLRWNLWNYQLLLY